MDEALRAIAQEVWEAAQATDVAEQYPALAETLYELGHRLHEDAGVRAERATPDGPPPAPAA